MRNNESNINDNYAQYLPNPPNFSLYLTPTNQPEIEKYLKSIKSYASGIDDISPKVLKHVSSIKSVPLLHILNTSLSAEVYPHKLKKAEVILLHKSGNITDIKNSRPISLLPAVSKVLEKAL